MKKIYISPEMLAEEISRVEIIATSNPPMVDSNATKTGGDTNYQGEGLSKDFSTFSFDNSDWE